MSEGNVFSFSTGKGNDGLFLRAPRDDTRSNEEGVSIDRVAVDL